MATITSKEPEENPQGTFKTKVGLILSCIGCMVGTGNIWRFPRILANNSGDEGCLQFLMVWVVFLFLWSIPMILIEYGLGRYTKKSSILAFSALVGPKSAWCGAWVALVSIGISGYYSVVLGWCIYYFIVFFYAPLPGSPEESLQMFHEFAQDSALPVLFHFVSILLAALTVLWSVKSIEVVNSIIVPFFLLLIFVSFIWSLTFEYGSRGLAFMFTPDWAEFSSPRMWVDAISQNAFDTGAAGGLFVTYSTFMTANNGVVRYGRLIPIGNNLISLTCGMLTFSTVFSTQIQAGKNQTQILNILRENGPANTGLSFVWFPILYGQVTGGRVLILIFFFSLTMAGFSSLVAQIEMFVHNVVDLGVNRVPATVGCCTVVFLLGLGSALNLNFLQNQDFVWGFGLLISGLMFLYLVIRFGVRNYRETLYNNFSVHDWRLGLGWEYLIKILAPIEGVFLIVWWAVDTIANSTASNPWYGLSPESFMATVLQWGGWLLILFVVNRVILACYKHSWDVNGEDHVALPEADEMDITRELEVEDQAKYSTFSTSQESQQ